MPETDKLHESMYHPLPRQQQLQSSQQRSYSDFREDWTQADIGAYFTKRSGLGFRGKFCPLHQHCATCGLASAWSSSSSCSTTTPCKSRSCLDALGSVDVCRSGEPLPFLVFTYARSGLSYWRYRVQPVSPNVHNAIPPHVGSCSPLAVFAAVQKSTQVQGISQACG